MAGPTHHTEAWVLAKRPPSDSFQTLTIFTRAEGAVLALQRLSKKSNSTTLDLFDEAALLLETPSQGAAVFIKEVRLQRRLTEIGKSYEGLRLASTFATLVARNPVPEESREGIYQLLGQAFEAFAQGNRAEVVYLKSLYRFCRDEGYPLKQAWFPTLTATDRAAVASILNLPLAEQTTDSKTVARLQRRLEDYLRGETEIILD